jgi:hypothetical protein
VRLARPAPGLIVAASVVSLLLTGCRTVPDVRIDRTTVISWADGSGGTAGQVIVEIHNEGSSTTDPDLFGRGEHTVAVLLDASGAELDHGRPIHLDAVPQTLAPGEHGFLIASFRLDAEAGTASDAEIVINATAGDPRPRPTLDEVEIANVDDGLGAIGRLAWDGSGSAVARVIGLDSTGRPLGFVATDEVRYSDGDVTLCCFPPGAGRDEIVELLSFGLLVRD